MWTDDPVKDAERHFTRLEREAEERLKKLPVCSDCRRKIKDEQCFVFDDEFICFECLVENHMKETEYYVS